MAARKKNNAQSERRGVLYGDILNVVDSGNHNETCFIQAVRCNRVDILPVICYKGFNKWDDALAEAIAIPDTDNRTCLHSIIDKDDAEMNLDLLQLLVKKSDHKALLHQRERGDDPGNTALHDFVNAEKSKVIVKRCPLDQDSCDKCKNNHKLGIAPTDCESYKKKYIETLRMLVDGCPGSMVTLNKAGKTPYLFNKATRARKKFPSGQREWTELEFDAQDIRQDEKRQPNPTLKGKEDGGLKEKNRQNGEVSDKPTTNKPTPSVRGQNRRDTTTGSAVGTTTKGRIKHSKMGPDDFEGLAAAVARFLLGEAFALDNYEKTYKSLLGNMQRTSLPQGLFPGSSY